MPATVCCILGCALLAFSLRHASAAPLSAGIAVADITPPVGGPLPGYATQRRAVTIHDPLFARVLLLRTRDTSLVLVATDLYRLYSPELVARIRRELNIQHAILSSTHNASAPSLEPDTRSVWARETENKIFDAARQASEKLFPAEIRWGLDGIVAAHNIRLVQDDGTVRERWSNPQEEGTAPIDSILTVIRVDRVGGGPAAVLLHHACEPAVLGRGNRAISADYPGALVRYVEKELGGTVTCLFVGGAAANIYPFRSRLPGPEGFAEIERMGQRLGRRAVEVASRLAPPASENELQVRGSVLSFAGRWQPQSRFEVGVTTVLIDRTLALFAVPAETFAELQVALSADSPVRRALVLGSSYSLGKSWAGYMPSIAAAAEGGFGASSLTEVEVGAGEAVVDHGIMQIYRLLRKLDDLPRGRLVDDLVPDLASP